MPRRTPCPACAAQVKVPDGTPANAKVTCPACDEKFVPPWLKMKVVEGEPDEDAYDPETAERYVVKRTQGRDRPPVKRRAKSQAEEDDETWKPRRGGIENVLLFVGLGLAVAFPVGYFLANWAVKRNSQLGEMLVVVAAAALLLVVTGMVFIRRRVGFLNRIFGPW